MHHIYIYIYIYMCVCVCVCVCMCVSVYLCVCVCPCTYVCVCTDKTNNFSIGDDMIMEYLRMHIILCLWVKLSTFYGLITFYIGLFVNQSLVLIQQLCAVLNVNKRSVDRDLDVYGNLLSKLVLNVNKRSVDRDLDVYRNLLSKLVQAKELLKEYVDR